MSIALDRKLAVWKPLKVGMRVESKTWKKGVRGVVWERLGSESEPMNGLRRYGVRLDCSENVADFCRYELKVIPKNSDRRAVA